jgi:hypothetical protein
MGSSVSLDELEKIKILSLKGFELKPFCRLIPLPIGIPVVLLLGYVRNERTYRVFRVRSHTWTACNVLFCCGTNQGR